MGSVAAKRTAKNSVFLDLFRNKSYLLYLAHSYHEYFQKTDQNYYGSKKVKMPKPEIYVIYTGERGKKPDRISLAKEFFGGESVGVEVKAKVIYESGSGDIINQYIVFCKVFNEQTRQHGLTREAVAETIRICRDRGVLREYLAEREKEVVTIMMSLFDEEQIMKSYVRSERREAAQKTERAMVKRLIRNGKMSLEEIAECAPSLSMDELREIEAEVMGLV